ncbi:LexA family transcriptional regulator [Pseudomonas sp. ML96]|uniref:LexA family transcriptional regulator n=1 Tax=Pseudomonas sp. ML96 TaxID=1523503 RepID=UPI00069087FE|nr:LexA family transcriptional regulator [Pseudomonas sp. ML96]
MKPFDLTTLGGRIAFARKTQKLTQAELAKLAGIGQSSIALLESGSTKAPQRALELAQALQVSLEWLLHGESPPTSNSSKLTPDLIQDSKLTSLAVRLAFRREQCGLTQAQLADKSGLSQATIGNLETGRNKGTKRILELALALHITPEWLLHGGNLNAAKGNALRRDLAVPTSEQRLEREMQRLLSMQVIPVETKSPRNALPANAPLTLPIIDWFDQALATPLQTYLSHESRGSFPSPFKQSPSSFWMRVPTDVMSPEYQENDLILVDPELLARNNDDIVVRDTNGTPEFGRLRQTFDGRYIEILNPLYPVRMKRLEKGSVVVGVVNGMVRQPRARD